MIAEPSTPTATEFFLAVSEAAARYYERSGLAPEAIYMAPDRFFYLLGLMDSLLVPLDVGDVGGMAVVTTHGLTPGTTAIGPFEIADDAPAPNRAARRALRKRESSDNGRTSEEHGALIEWDARSDNPVRYELVHL